MLTKYFFPSKISSIVPANSRSMITRYIHLSNRVGGYLLKYNETKPMQYVEYSGNNSQYNCFPYILFTL